MIFSVTLFGIQLHICFYAARNAVVVLIAAVIGYTLSIQPWFNNQITLIQYNESIMPDFELPDLSIQTCQVCPCILPSCPLMALASYCMYMYTYTYIMHIHMYAHIDKYAHQQHVKMMIACIVAIIFEGHLHKTLCLRRFMDKASHLTAFYE